MTENRLLPTTLEADKPMNIRVAGNLSRLGILLLLSLDVAAQQRLSPAEAKQHVGEIATVCGLVASTKFAAGTRGQPTFLNLDRPYPNQIFTILIWGTDRSRFGEPELEFREKRVCVSGEIAEYRGVPEIVLSDPARLTVQNK
jgi:hypothetical protein